MKLATTPGQFFCIRVTKIFKKLNKYRNKFHQTPTAYGIFNGDGSIKYDFSHSLKLYNEAEAEINHFDFLKNQLNNESIILDFGCGNGGRTIFYEKYFSSKVVGIDIDEIALNIATKFKDNLYPDAQVKFEKSTGKIPIKSGAVDAIFMNDVMEHVDNPIEVLSDCFMVLKTGGYLCINFNSYWSPAGHHLSDWIPIPWAHLFFSEKTLVNTLKNLSKTERYIEYQFPNVQKNVNSFNELGSSTLNYITIRKFLKYIKNSPFSIEHFELNGYDEKFKNQLIANLFRRLKYLPLLREFLGGRIVCILKKN